ncbi:MAG: nucleotidyltransferase domain-containing protein [Holophagales bacterium]|nr:nucleotidyltransferase domain-containing protein [Holophagales bacterium]
MDELKIITSIINEYAPDCRVLVFGSRRDGTAKKYSDLDLAFVGKEKLGLNRCVQLEDAFAESDLPYRVDVLDYHALSPEFRGIIDSGNEVLYIQQI